VKITRRELCGLLGKAVLAASVPVNALCGFLPESEPEKSEPAFQFGFTGWKGMDEEESLFFGGSLVVSSPRMSFKIVGVKI